MRERVHVNRTMKDLVADLRFYIFSIVFYMIHYFDTIAKHPFLVALQMHPYQCSSLQYPPRIDKPAPSLIHHTLKRCLDVYAESPLLLYAY